MAAPKKSRFGPKAGGGEADDRAAKARSIAAKIFSEAAPLPEEFHQQMRQRREANGDNENNEPQQNSSPGCKLYVGNLNYDVREQDLRQIFEAFGNLIQCNVVMDREDRTRSRGFAFVEFDNTGSAQQALDANSTEVHGRSIAVRMAQEKGQPRTETDDRGGRGGHGGRGRGGRGRGRGRGGGRGRGRGGYGGGHDRRERDYGRRDYGGQRDQGGDRNQGGNRNQGGYGGDQGGYGGQQGGYGGQQGGYGSQDQGGYEGQQQQDYSQGGGYGQPKQSEYNPHQAQAYQPYGQQQQQPAAAPQQNYGQPQQQSYQQPPAQAQYGGYGQTAPAQGQQAYNPQQYAQPQGYGQPQQQYNPNQTQSSAPQTGYGAPPVPPGQ